MQQNQDEVDDWSIGPRLSCSLHLEDILNEDKGSHQNGHSAESETVDKNLSDKIKLFQLYVSACERNDPGSGDSDSSDESIHHGRDSCASSRGRRDNQPHSTLDSFLLKPDQRSRIGGEAESVSSSSLASSAVDRVRRPSVGETSDRRPLLSYSFSGWPCQRIEATKPAAFGSFQAERRPRSDSFHRSTPADRADYEMYKTQVVAALTLGKPVWL